MLAVDAVVVCQAGMDDIRVSKARLGLPVQAFALMLQRLSSLISSSGLCSFNALEIAAPKTPSPWDKAHTRIACGA